MWAGKGRRKGIGRSGLRCDDMATFWLYFHREGQKLRDKSSVDPVNKHRLQGAQREDGNAGRSAVLRSRRHQWRSEPMVMSFAPASEFSVTVKTLSGIYYMRLKAGGGNPAGKSVRNRAYSSPMDEGWTENDSTSITLERKGGWSVANTSCLERIEWSRLANCGGINVCDGRFGSSTWYTLGAWWSREGAGTAVSAEPPPLELAHPEGLRAGQDDALRLQSGTGGRCRIRIRADGLVDARQVQALGTQQPTLQTGCSL